MSWVLVVVLLYRFELFYDTLHDLVFPELNSNEKEETNRSTGRLETSSLRSFAEDAEDSKGA